MPATLDAAAANDTDRNGKRGVIYAVAPSPLQAPMVWVGTDDGLIHVTTDDGKSWQDVTPPAVTPWSRVTGVEASHFDLNTAYASVDRHQLQDFDPYIYRTRDLGKSWQKITSGLPAGVYVHVVKEDPMRRGLLFAGTERGAFLSLDDGDHWQPLQLNLPVTSVRDFEVYANDLIVATHGRGFWVIDDISPLRQINDAVLSAEAFLFKPADGINYIPDRRQWHAAAEGRAAGTERAQRRQHRLLPEEPGDGASPAGDSRCQRRHREDLHERCRPKPGRGGAGRRPGRDPQHVTAVALDAGAVLRRGGNAPRHLRPWRRWRSGIWRWGWGSRRSGWWRRGGRSSTDRGVHGPAHRQWEVLQPGVHDEGGSEESMTVRRLGLLMLILALPACDRKDDPGAAATTADSAAPGSGGTLLLGPTDVAQVIESSITGGVQISGPLDPSVSVEIKAQIDGNVRDLQVDRGSAVIKGESLATIDGAGVQGSASAAKAATASAEADLAVADQSYAAAQRLYAAGAISELDLKAATAQRQGAAARLANARTQADIAQENLKYSTVASPITGSVSARVVEEGQAVRKGDQMLTLVDTRVLELKGRIGVNAAAGVRVGQKVTFTLDAVPGRSFEGRIARIDPVADPGTRQVGVYAQLPNGDHHLVAGQYAHGRIAAGGASTQGLAVPSSAVRTEEDGSHSVLVIANARVAKRPVEIGAVDDVNGLTFVAKGLQKGELVIAGTAVIVDGAAVRLPAGVSGTPN